MGKILAALTLALVASSTEVRTYGLMLNGDGAMPQQVYLPRGVIGVDYLQGINSALNQYSADYWPTSCVTGVHALAVVGTQTTLSVDLETVGGAADVHVLDADPSVFFIDATVSITVPAGFYVPRMTTAGFEPYGCLGYSLGLVVEPGACP